MKTIKIENIIQTKEVAKILGCTPRNISLMVRKNKLKPIKILENKEFIFDLDDVKNMKKCRLYEDDKN